MANNNSPRGLVPYRNIYDAYMTGGLGLYYIPSTEGSNIFIGDPLIPTGASDAYGIPAVTLATAGATNLTIGPMVSIAPGGPNTKVLPVTRDLPVYHAASSAAEYILVAHDPNELFWIQEDSVGGSITVATAGMKNADMIAGAGGSTTTGYSSWMLDSNTAAAASPTLQLRIVRLLMEDDNTGGISYAKWLVKINLHFLKDLNGL